VYYAVIGYVFPDGSERLTFIFSE